MNSPTSIANTRWFRSAPVAPDFSASNIDAEKGVITDVVMVQEGEAKGHEVHLEAEFIENLVRYDRQQFAKIGLKGRFGHPSASGETMGTQMGVFYNFRKREKAGKMQAIADLRLLDAAEQSPTHPGMKSWVLSMAAERPDFIMSSIVFRGSGYYQRKPNGNKHRLELSADYWMDGSIWSNFKEEWGNVYVEFDPENGAEHFYTDLVEAGAATENLFGTKANPDFLVSRAHQFLDENPDLLAFVKAHPERLQGFLQRLGISIPQTQQKKMAKNTLLAWLFGNTEEAPEPSPEELAALKTQLGDAKTELDRRLAELKTQMEGFQTAVQEWKKEVEALKVDLEALKTELAEVKKQPAAALTAGESNPPAGGGGEKSYDKNDITVRARALRRKQEG